MNQFRGLLGEYGIVIPQGVVSVRKAIPLILEDAENGLTIAFRDYLNQAYQHLALLDGQIAYYKKKSISRWPGMKRLKG